MTSPRPQKAGARPARRRTRSAGRAALARRLDPKTGPPHLEVWRSVRAHGDTKRKSRRTLTLSGLCVDALRGQRVQQAKDRLAAGEQWTETGLVFTTRLGTGMDAANARRDLRRALALVPGLPLRIGLRMGAGLPMGERGQTGWPRRSAFQIGASRSPF